LKKIKNEESTADINDDLDILIYLKDDFTEELDEN
jgi:hypothetical protein